MQELLYVHFNFFVGYKNISPNIDGIVYFDGGSNYYD